MANREFKKEILMALLAAHSVRAHRLIVTTDSD